MKRFINVGFNCRGSQPFWPQCSPPYFFYQIIWSLSLLLLSNICCRFLAGLPVTYYKFVFNINLASSYIFIHITTLNILGHFSYYVNVLKCKKVLLENNKNACCSVVSTKTSLFYLIFNFYRQSVLIFIKVKIYSNWKQYKYESN